jgi:hypothetical protein
MVVGRAGLVGSLSLSGPAPSPRSSFSILLDGFISFKKLVRVQCILHLLLPPAPCFASLAQRYDYGELPSLPSSLNAFGRLVSEH